MSTPANARRAIIVSSMANASLFDVIKAARERRNAAVQRANDAHARAMDDANMAFVNDVVNAHIELDNSIRALEDDCDDDEDDEDE